jgi:selenocysteine lyase/cysteine desulfurase
LKQHRKPFAHLIERFPSHSADFLIADPNLAAVRLQETVGVQHTDVRASNIDALAVSTQKGLLALYGMGFLYVRREWADRLQPAYLARFGVDLGDAHEASIGGYDFQLAAGARRFDLGNYNFLATAAVDASMKQLLDFSKRATASSAKPSCQQVRGEAVGLDLWA